MNSSKLLKTSSFPFKKYIQALREQSSMKETLYAYLLKELNDMGAHTTEWIISKIPFALLSLLGNGFFTFFPCTHPLQVDSCFVWNSGRPDTALLAIGSAL